MRKTAFKNSGGGFTLAEMMLVMFIAIMLTAAALTGFLRSQQSFVFNAADQQVQSLVREARSLAVTGKAQPDYTDYDGDGCKDAGNHTADCLPAEMPADESDFVTPANYGVYFNKTDGTLTLFADIHENGGGSLIDGEFDDPGSVTAIGTYKPDSDLVLSIYTLPETIDLIIDPDDGSEGYTVLYSPIFADVTFDEGTETLPAPLFKYGIVENNGTRARCMVIHPISGVPESSEKASEACPYFL